RRPAARAQSAPDIAGSLLGYERDDRVRGDDQQDDHQGADDRDLAEVVGEVRHPLQRDPGVAALDYHPVAALAPDLDAATERHLDRADQGLVTADAAAWRGGGGGPR